ncbi:MAG: Ig domain-containing protein [Acholeplasmataceae bacterium]
MKKGLLLNMLFVLCVAWLLAACEELQIIDEVTVIGEDTVEIGDEPNYTAVVEPEPDGLEIEWSVEEDTGSATITDDGTLTPLEPGIVTVKATVDDVEGILEVTITQPVTGVTVTGDDVVFTDEDATYELDLDPEDATFDEVEWTVLAETGSATIDSDGHLSPTATGTVTVRASVDGIIGTMTVTIVNPVVDVTLVGPTEVALGEDPTYEIDVEPDDAYHDDIAWSVTDDTGSATIDDEGVLDPVSAGMITVVVEVQGITRELEVEIITPVDSVEVTGDEVIMPDDRPVYSAEVLPEDATYPEVTWSVEDETGSATISDEGELEPVESGTVRVIATADGVEGELVVEIEEDDRLLGTPRPPHLLATPENTINVDAPWYPESDLEGLDVTFDRQVYDVSFTAEASRSSKGVVFEVPNDIDLSRMQYFGIKMTGMTETTGVNPTVSVHMRDLDSGLELYNDQHTEIELTEDNQWVVFSIANRYRLQTENRDLVIFVDPHYTASGNAGVVTMQQVVFFGDEDPVTEPELLSPLKQAHWEEEPIFTADPAVDEIDGDEVDVMHISATAEAVEGYRALPAYVLEDISRKTAVEFSIKLLTEDLPSDPGLIVTLGDTDIDTVMIDRPDEGEEAEYQDIVVEIPDSKRTEATMWSARYIQIKVFGGGDEPVEYYVHDFRLTGDANPEPVEVTRADLGGDNIPMTGNINYVENAEAEQVEANDDPAHVLFQPNDHETLSKLEFGYEKTSGNQEEREGLNGVYVKIQGEPGVEINIQQGWADGWADEEQRRFVLDGTVQEIEILAANRSDITSGEGWFPFQFNVSMPNDEMEDVEIKIFEFALTAILPEEEPVKDKEIPFGTFNEGGNTIIEDDPNDIDALIVDEDDDGNAVATVVADHENNHVVAIAYDPDIRYMTTLTVEIQGEVGAEVNIKLAYGNTYNYDEDYVHTFTTDEPETIEIEIIDRDALKTSKISLSLFFELNEVEEPADFVIYDAYFSGDE